VVQWVGAEGDLVEGLLQYPLDWDPNDRSPRPLVLDIHGGPSGVDRDRWDSNWGSPNILWRQRGAFVMQVNYHGSSSYGLDWVESIAERYYELEIPDIELGVDALIEQGLVDPGRLATTGWSNGGILSAALITQTQRYKAAVVGAADVEWISDWGNVAFGASFDNYYFGGPPWERLEHYIEKSPYFQLTEVTTPTLIHTGDADTNVPPSQSWSMFRALQQIGNTEVRFVLYPGEPHGLRSVAHQERKLREDLAWLDRHLFGMSARTDYFEHDPALPPDSPLLTLFEARRASRRADGALGVEAQGVLVPETTTFGDLEVARFEVTRAQHGAMTGIPVPAHEANLPALLTFEEANTYAAWLSRQTGQTYRLPTLEEAEKLARTGGNTLDRWLGYAPTVDDLATVDAALTQQLGNDLASLLIPVHQDTAHRGRTGQAAVWGLGGNVAEWATGTAAGTAGGQAVGPSADLPAERGTRQPRLLGARLVRVENS
jgi:dienelactone hydrolase